MCECPDHQYRDVRCKHLRRVAYATGECPIPAWIETEEVDDQLGAQVNAMLRVAATDGGAIVDDDDGDAEADNRPEDCGCWDITRNFPVSALLKSSSLETGSRETTGHYTCQLITSNCMVTFYLVRCVIMVTWFRY